MSHDPTDFGAFLEHTVAADPELSVLVAAAERELEAERKETRFSGKRCPKCGASTLVNGVDEWCSFIGGQDQKACDWVKA